MEISLDQSYFGRAKEEQKFTLKKAKKIIRKYALQIIEFCKKQSMRLKKRNEYQSILFPQDYEYEESDEISQTLTREYQLEADYPFYLAKCQLFIDNYHLKIIKKASPLPIKFESLGYGRLRQFADWVESPVQSILIGITTLNIILVISISDKFFFKYRILSKRNEQICPLVNVSAYKEYFFAFSEQECHICRYANASKCKGLEKLIQKGVTDKKITKGEGIEKDGKFYVFLIVEDTLIIQRFELGILLSKIDYKNKVVHQCKQPILNLEIHPKRVNNTLNQVIIAIATLSQVKLLSYNFENEVFTILASKESPLMTCPKIPTSPYLLNFIQRQNYLLCAIGFRNRLYFARIEDDYCEFSRRIKFDRSVEAVQPLGKSFGMVVITTEAKQNKSFRKIYVTHEDKLISYKEYVYTNLVEKFQLTYETTCLQEQLDCMGSAIYIYDHREVLILGQNQIHRIVLNTWQGIYNEMKLTENIKLLKFLILLKHINSPFLQPPSSFESLESFFPANIDEAKQILIEYYYIMNMQPAFVDINSNNKLMIPFIIAHQISNLNDAVLENLLNWCLKQDERLVEELIIGGSDCGWEIAVSRGWIRAFKVMVERGMDLEMPILKLYSMSLFQKRVKKGEENETRQQLTAEGQKYLNQMIDYIHFILANFFQDLSGNGSHQEFKSIVMIILKDDMWKFMMKFAPIRAVSIISFIFCSEVRIKEINKLPPVDFIHFHKPFNGMLLGSGSTNSEVVVSHLSALFEEMKDDEKMEYVQLEHSKLLVLKFEEFIKINPDRTANFRNMVKNYQVFLSQPYYEEHFQNAFKAVRTKLKIKSYFKFQKGYLVSIVKILVKDQDSNLERIYNEARTSQSHITSYQEMQCEMVDFLIFLWQQIYFGIILEVFETRSCEDERYSMEECDTRIKSAIKLEIKKILSDIQENNFQYQYLSIHILMSINTEGEFTSKIFNKFLTFKDSIIKERLFIWLRQALPRSASLQEELIVKLKEVIAINNDQSRSLLQNFYEGKEKEIIKKIDNDPYLQLQYLELIIKNANEQLERYYTNLHIELVLKIKPETLIAILESNNEMVEYDIAQTLKMTLNANDFQNKNEVLCYLYEREGEIVHCIDTYLTSFESLIYSYFVLCERNKMDQEEDLVNLTYLMTSINEHEVQRNRIIGQINKQFEESIKLLFRVTQLNYDYIARYLRKLNSILTAVSSRDYKKKAHCLQFIIDYFGIFIISLFERNCLIQLGQWIREEKNELLQFILQMNKYLIDGYDKMLIQIIILKSMSVMQKSILIKQIHEALKKLQYCISSEAYCFVCERSFEEQYSTVEGLLFNCGHIYHKSCIDQVNDQDFCYYCVSQYQYKSMIENQSLFLVELLKKFREKRKLKKSQEVIRVEGRKKDMLISQAKKRSNRLGLYDKKITTIQNQAQIIDLKLLIDDYYSNQAKKR